MKTPITLLAVLFFAVMTEGYAADKTPAPSHGVSYPEGWQNWATIAVSHRTDNNTLRVILGNDAAVKAARAGYTNPWPDGAILGKVVWKDAQLENWGLLLRRVSLYMPSLCSKTQSNIQMATAGAGRVG